MAPRRMQRRYRFHRSRTLIVAGDDVAEDVAGDTGEALGFFFAAADGRGDSIGQPAERQSLQNDVPGPGQCGVEESFAAEQRIAKTADVLDVVADRLGKRDDAAGVDSKLFAGRKSEFQHVPAGVKKDESLPADLLQNESLPAEKTGAEALREGHREI